MTDNTVTLRINADASGVRGGVDAAKAQLDGLGAAGEAGGKRAAAGLGEAERAAVGVSNSTRAAARATSSGYDAMAAAAERSAKRARSAFGEQGQALAALIGQIDPLAGKFAKLDDQLAALKKFKASGAISGEDFSHYAAKIETARLKVDQIGHSTQKFTLQTAAARRELGYMIKDLATGQPGRFAQSFSTLAVRSNALSIAMSGTGAAIGLVVGTLGLFVVAAAKGYNEQRAFQGALVHTGNIAGVTVGQLDKMRDSIAGSDADYSDASAALTQLAADGRITGDALQYAGQAAVSLAAVTGEKIGAAVKQIAALGKDPVDAIVKLNDQYHFLTLAEYNHIAALQAEGHAQAATTAAAQAAAAAFKQRADEMQDTAGVLVKAAHAVGVGFADMWKNIKDLGRTDAQYKLEQTQLDLEALQAKIAKGIGNVPEEQRYVAVLEAKIIALQKTTTAQNAAAKATADAQRINDAGITAQQQINKLLDANASKSDKVSAAVKRLNSNYGDLVKAQAAAFLSAATSGNLLSGLSTFFGQQKKNITDYITLFKALTTAQGGQKSAAATMVDSLQKEIAVFGMSTNAVRLYNAENVKGSAGDRARAITLAKQRNALDDAAAATKAITTAQKDQQALLDKQIEKSQTLTEKLSGASAAQIAFNQTVIAAQAAFEATISSGGDYIEAMIKLGETVGVAAAAEQKETQIARDRAAASKHVTSAYDAEKQAAQNMARIVDSSAQSMSDAFAGWMTGTLSQGKSFAAQMVDLIKQMVAQMIAAFLKVKVFGPILQTVFGGMLGQGGGSGSVSLFGGGSGSGDMVGTIGSWFGNAYTAGEDAGGFGSSAGWLGAGKSLWSGFSDGFGGMLSKFAGLLGFGGATTATTAYGISSVAALEGAGMLGGGTLGSLGIGTYTGLAGYTGASAALPAGWSVTGAGVSSGAASGTAAGAASGVSWVPIIGWIIAAVMENISLYQQGWRNDDPVNDDLYNGGALSSGLFLSGLNGPGMIDKTLQALGLNDFLSSLLSGSSGFVKLFGHQKAHATGQGFTANFGDAGVDAKAYVDWKAAGGWFRDAKRGTESVDLPDDITAALDKLWSSIQKSIQRAGQQLGVTAAEAVSGFSASLKTHIDTTKKDATTEYIVSVLGRSWTEATQDKALERIGAEGIIQVIDKWLSAGADAVAAKPPTGPAAPGGGMHGTPDRLMPRAADGMDSIGAGMTSLGDQSSALAAVAGEASKIAEQWRDDADKLAEGAQFLLTAATDMKHGLSLIGTDGAGSLTTIAALTAELAQQNETLTDTYERLRTETSVYRQSMSLAGVTLSQSGEDVVRFADDLANALGGVQNMQQIAQQFAQTYYSTGVLAVQSIAQLRDQADGMLAGIGLNGNTSMSDFADAYAQAAATLTPEQLAAWWQAGLALAQLNQQIDALAAAKQQYTDYIDGINSQISVHGPGEDWAVQLHAVTTNLQQMIAQANALAKAAGLAGASEQDLAKIHKYAAMQAAALIAQLRASSVSLASQLYGDGSASMTLDQLNARIAELQSSSSSAAGGISDAVDTITRSTSLLYGDLSPYKDAQKLQYAKQAYLTGAASAQDVLGIGKRLYASGSDYNQLFDWVRSHAQQQSSAGGSAASGGSNNSAELASLIKQRDALEAQQRQSMAQQLAGNLADYAAATGESFEDIAKEWGFSLDQLANDLHVTDIDKYLSTLQGQDIPGALGTTADTIVAALQDLGAELIAAILGQPISPPSGAAIEQTQTGAVGDIGEPTGMQSVPGPTMYAMSAPTDNPKFDALIAENKALNARIDALGRVLADIAHNTQRTADADEAQVETQRAIRDDTQLSRLRGLPA